MQFRLLLVSFGCASALAQSLNDTMAIDKAQLISDAGQLALLGLFEQAPEAQNGGMDVDDTQPNLDDEPATLPWMVDQLNIVIAAIQPAARDQIFEEIVMAHHGRHPTQPGFLTALGRMQPCNKKGVGSILMKLYTLEIDHHDALQALRASFDGSDLSVMRKALEEVELYDRVLEDHIADLLVAGCLAWE